MKTDLNALKQDLKKLTDLDYLKKELAKITSELKKFDIPASLTPQAKNRLRAVEKRFNEVKKGLVKLQKQVDQEVNKIVKIVRKTTNDSLKSVGFTTTGATTRKATTRKTARKASSSAGSSKTTRKSPSKTTRKSTRTKKS